MREVQNARLKCPIEQMQARVHNTPTLKRRQLLSSLKSHNLRQVGCALYFGVANKQCSNPPARQSSGRFFNSSFCST